MDDYYKIYYGNFFTKQFLSYIQDVVLLQNKLVGRPSVHVLDSGCGSGFYSSYILNSPSIPAKKKVVGVDIQDWLDEKLRRHREFEFFRRDGSNTGFKSSSFDIVLSLDVLEHTEDDSAYLRECYRLLREDGVFILVTPNINRVNAVLMRLLHLTDKKFPKLIQEDIVEGKKVSHVHLREYSSKELMSKLSIFTPNILNIPFFVGLKFPKIGFVGSYNTHLNRFVKRYTDHHFVVCSKDPSVLSSLAVRANKVV